MPASRQNPVLVHDCDDMQIAVERFDAYRVAYEGGESLDVPALVHDLTPAQRAKLDSLVDAFLVQAPRRPFDERAFDRSRTAETVDRSLRRAARERKPN